MKYSATTVLFSMAEFSTPSMLYSVQNVSGSTVAFLEALNSTVPTSEHERRPLWDRHLLRDFQGPQRCFSSATRRCGCRGGKARKAGQKEAEEKNKGEKIDG